MAGCGDVLSLEDLQTAKKHQIFEAEVITGKAGGVAGGATIDTATNPVTGQTQKTLPAVLRDAGFRPASFTFETGGTLAVGDSDVAVLWPVSSGGDGQYYIWKGAYPKVVPAASSPATTGGVSDAGWLPWGDITLRGELASTNGASRIGTSSGDTVQGVIDDVSSSVAYLDSYSSLVVSGDWTAALQAALDTGRPVVTNPSRVHNIGGIVQSKGNRVIGTFKINPTRADLSGFGQFTFDDREEASFMKNLKLLYVFKVYDLIELMFIRSLGFNAILHAGSLYVDRPELEGESLKTAIMLALDNAQTAGLGVNMTTGWEIATDTMAIDYVTTFAPHPAVWGFSVFDEPSFNNVTVARQNERLAALRAITDKNLNCVDSIINYSAYRNGYNPWARGYDVMFVDSYCHTTSGATLQENINNDLRDMRRDVGVAAVYCPESKIIPVAGLFISPNFTESVPQIDATTSKLVRAAGGDFGVWAWDPLDPGVSAGVKASSELRTLSKSFCGMSMGGGRIPRAYRVGGTGLNPESIPPCAAKDGLSLMQKQDGVTTFVQSGTTCLGVLRPGADAEFAFNGLSFPIGGILFKGSFPVAVTNIEVDQFITADFELIDVTGSQSGNMLFHYSQDEGATISPSTLSLPFDFSTGTPAISRSLYFGAGSYWLGSKFAVQLAVNAPAQPGFRICMHGFIVTSEW